ncbi:MAG TPA: PRC-barrel domain-containing protein [Thermohalobaculum sp.]|nr:PRC-barrel domain-containing protein [Thermohalobaculum sp.]
MDARALTAAVAAALVVAGPAGAACNIDEAGVAERHAALAAERGGLTAEARQGLHSLRQSAETLDRGGFPVACDAVVDAAMQLLEGDAAWSAEAEAPAGPETTVGALNLVTFAATGRPVETASLVGRQVYSTAGEPLGIVDGVLLDQSRDASHLVVAHGGAWEAGERMLAVPAERMLLDPDTGRLFTEIPAVKLAEAPLYDRAERWRPEENDAWYDQRAAEAVAEAGDKALEDRTAERAAADAARAGATASGPATSQEVTVIETEDGPLRIRVEKDRPENAAGSND